MKSSNHLTHWFTLENVGCMRMQDTTYFKTIGFGCTTKPLHDQVILETKRERNELLLQMYEMNQNLDYLINQTRISFQELHARISFQKSNIFLVISTYLMRNQLNGYGCFYNQFYCYVSYVIGSIGLACKLKTSIMTL